MVFVLSPDKRRNRTCEVPGLDFSGNPTYRALTRLASRYLL